MFQTKAIIIYAISLYPMLCKTFLELTKDNTKAVLQCIKQRVHSHVFSLCHVTWVSIIVHLILPNRRRLVLKSSFQSY